MGYPHYVTECHEHHAVLNRPVLRDIDDERIAQDEKWGEQNHGDGTGGEKDRSIADFARQICEENFKAGIGTWRDILFEEVAEAFAESDPALLRTELVQVAAVAASWVEAIDRRTLPIEEQAPNGT